MSATITAMSVFVSPAAPSPRTHPPRSLRVTPSGCRGAPCATPVSFPDRVGSRTARPTPAAVPRSRTRCPNRCASAAPTSRRGSTHVQLLRGNRGQHMLARRLLHRAQPTAARDPATRLRARSRSDRRGLRKRYLPRQQCVLGLGTRLERLRRQPAPRAPRPRWIRSTPCQELCGPTQYPATRRCSHRGGRLAVARRVREPSPTARQAAES